MPIPITYLRTASTLENLVQTGQFRQALLINAQLEDEYDALLRAGALTPADAVEMLGMVASILKRAQQPEMALSWYETLCYIARRVFPESEDTAWDFYHLGECFEELDQVEQAVEAFQQTRKISRDSNLLDKSTNKISKLWPGMA